MRFYASQAQDLIEPVEWNNRRANRRLRYSRWQNVQRWTYRWHFSMNGPGFG